MEHLRDTKDESLEEFVKKLPNSWRDKGLREGKKEVARKLINKGYNTAEICDITELSENEVEELKA